MLARVPLTAARLVRSIFEGLDSSKMTEFVLDASRTHSRSWNGRTSSIWNRGLSSSSTNALIPLENASRPRERVPERQGEMQDVKYPVIDFRRQEVRPATLLGKIFDVPLRRDIAYRVVRWQLAKRREGNHKTKTRGEVSGSNRKMYRQKGTGRARHSTSKAPQFRGGGVAHGPVLRSHAHKLQKKVRRLGLKVALSAKAAEGRLLILDSLKLPEYKTRELVTHLAELLPGAPRNSVLFVDIAGSGTSKGIGNEVDVGIRHAARNLSGVDIIPVEGLNVYDILRKDTLVITEEALRGIEERLQVE